MYAVGIEKEPRMRARMEWASTVIKGKQAL